jgi:hypothetical protein
MSLQCAGDASAAQSGGSLRREARPMGNGTVLATSAPTDDSPCTSAPNE